jgi:hypothetical protein
MEWLPYYIRDVYHDCIHTICFFPDQCCADVIPLSIILSPISRADFNVFKWIKMQQQLILFSDLCYCAFIVFPARSLYLFLDELPWSLHVEAAFLTCCFLQKDLCFQKNSLLFFMTINNGITHSNIWKMISLTYLFYLRFFRCLMLG